MKLLYQDRKGKLNLYLNYEDKYSNYCLYNYYEYRANSFQYRKPAINKFIKLIRKYDPDNVVDLIKLTALKFKDK